MSLSSSSDVFYSTAGLLSNVATVFLNDVLYMHAILGSDSFLFFLDEEPVKSKGAEQPDLFCFALHYRFL